MMTMISNQLTIRLLWTVVVSLLSYNTFVSGDPEAVLERLPQDGKADLLNLLGTILKVFDDEDDSDNDQWQKENQKSPSVVPPAKLIDTEEELPFASPPTPLVNRPQSFEELWNNYHLWDFMIAIGCPAVGDDGAKDPKAYQQIPTQQNTFDYMYKAFHQVVPAEDQSTLGTHYTYPFPPDVPIEVQSRPYSGRGLFATANITKGTTLWIPSNFAQFPSAHHFYQFLKVLWDFEVEQYSGAANDEHDPASSASCTKDHTIPTSTESPLFTPELVCNAILWSYTFRTGVIEAPSNSTSNTNRTSNSTTTNSTTTPNQSYTYRICIDFDEGSLINGATTEDEINVIEQMPDGTGVRDYFGDECSLVIASRDILEGEELLQNYHDSVDPDGWDYVELWWS